MALALFRELWEFPMWNAVLDPARGLPDFVQWQGLLGEDLLGRVAELWTTSMTRSLRTALDIRQNNAGLLDTL
jgi:hypothetical protein